jgi:hypothetical protein
MFGHRGRLILCPTTILREQASHYIGLFKTTATAKTARPVAALGTATVDED